MACNCGLYRLHLSCDWDSEFRRFYRWQVISSVWICMKFEGFVFCVSRIKEACSSLSFKPAVWTSITNNRKSSRTLKIDVTLHKFFILTFWGKFQSTRTIFAVFVIFTPKSKQYDLDTSRPLVWSLASVRSSLRTIFQLLGDDFVCYWVPWAILNKHRAGPKRRSHKTIPLQKNRRQKLLSLLRQ